MKQLLNKTIEVKRLIIEQYPQNLNLESIRLSKTIKASFLRYKKEQPEILPKVLKANNLSISFNHKFLISKTRTLYKRTVVQNFVKHMRKQHAETLYLDYLDIYMPAIESKELFKRSLSGYYTNFVSMSNRTYNYTRAFITHCVKNTFVTIFRGKGHRKNNFGMKVLAKVSSGLIGYRGPKKSTVFARKGVIKEAGKLLSSHMTSLLDVIFTSNVSRWNRKSVRDLCPNLSYVQNIYINYSRPHGFIKLKNKRRV
jgi:hypothetical protein